MKRAMDINASKVDPKLLELLVCPLTKGRLSYDPEANELVSEKARLAYPIRDGVPIMLVSEARKDRGLRVDVSVRPGCLSFWFAPLLGLTPTRGFALLLGFNPRTNPLPASGERELMRLPLVAPVRRILLMKGIPREPNRLNPARSGLPLNRLPPPSPRRRGEGICRAPLAPSGGQ
jgi:uncharacterized protein YbaR (Trm112 family)